MTAADRPPARRVGSRRSALLTLAAVGLVLAVSAASSACAPQPPGDAALRPLPENTEVVREDASCLSVSWVSCHRTVILRDGGGGEALQSRTFEHYRKVKPELVAAAAAEPGASRLCRDNGQTCLYVGRGDGDTVEVSLSYSSR